MIHLNTVGSDHGAILLHTHPVPTRRRVPFRFDARWIENEEVQDVVQQAWDSPVSGSRSFSVYKKIQKCRASLTNWKRRKRVDSSRAIDDLKSRIFALKHAGVGPSQLEMQSLKRQLKEEWDKEELFRKQKSRINWLQHGDQNTRFFHTSVMQRRSFNRISCVEDVNGVWTTDPHDIQEEFQRFFSGIFMASGNLNVQDTVSVIPSKISSAMNHSLTRPIADLEVLEALKGMGPTKAPGVDGMTPLFFQTYWTTVGADIIAAVKSFFHTSHLLRSTNQTLITLIPKVNCPTKPSQFRPISLCNVTYKIITKILANRLKPILPLIISENQSAFIGDRQISDSILIAHEVMHSLKNRHNGKQGWVALKLYMAKAYDPIEWVYLEAVLRKFGFDEQWICWVMACVTTVSFATVINGEKGELFTPSRGIRQGCPLSPYLFILCAEGFHYLIQSAIEDNTLHGVKIGRHCPSISHLFFADDSILFWEATASGCNAIEGILRKYEAASGQMVNREKSSLFFSPNTPANVKSGISENLQIRCENRGGRYLGLPSIIGRSKTEVFRYVLDRISDKLKSWKNSVLNMAGRDVLLRTVALAMPNFVMQCFLLPKRVCKVICRAVRKFWWDSKEGENKINWVSWNKLCDRKSEGGLGFRDLHAFNLAFLAKQGWRLIQGPHSLFQRLFKGKYFHNSSFWEASCPNSSSWAWRSIFAGRDILKKGWRWNVGNGSFIDIWSDPWLPRALSFKVLSPPPPPDSSLYHVRYVSDLIDGDTHSCNLPLIKLLFLDYDIESITSIPISSQGIRDKGLWHYNSNGNFSVKSAYHLARSSVLPRRSHERGESSSGTPSNSLWKYLWSLSIPSKVKMFLWRCSHNAIAVLSNLCRKNINISPYCPRCHSKHETLEHMLFQCKLSREVWCGSPFGFVVSGSWNSIHFSEWWFSFPHTSQSSEDAADMGALFASICWFLWKARNKLHFDGLRWDSSSILEKASALCSEFKAANNSRYRRPISSGSTPHSRWLLPPIGCIKFNVDGAVRRQTGIVGVGIVARDYSGIILGTTSIPFPGLFSPRSAEALAFREALVLAANKGFSSIIVEGDSLEVVQALTQDGKTFSDCGSILSDCLELLPLFSSCSFKYVKRSCNRVAHSLAKKSLLGVRSETWGGPVPHFLSNLVLSDVRSSDRVISSE